MPSVEHEYYVEILNDVAMMMGFFASLDALPDGTRPDVLRINIATGGVFLGDAKVTESPNCMATQVRYQHYVNWLSASRMAMPSSVCGICFGKCGKAHAWKGLLADTLINGGLTVARLELCRIAFPIGLVWAQPCRVRR
jgi:hypothetical protein